MSYKTDRLVDLFPDAYAARERESLLFKLLDAIGAELMAADEKIKRLLKSHWVRYADGEALDGLGAIYGVTRRRLGGGQPESDAAFRGRLQSIVPMFTGGGTRAAILGAVRSALGLPFNLDQLRLQWGYEGLRKDIEALVKLTEFSPQGERVLENTVNEVGGASELILSVTSNTVAESVAQIDWTFDRGSARRLTLERLDSHEGVMSRDTFLMPAGKTLTFSDDRGRLSALLDGADVRNQFVNLDGTAPARLPPVPRTPSQWKFRARSGLYDIGKFGDDTFDLPKFHVELSHLRFQPLTFDVQVPYFIKRAVEELKARYEYPVELFIFEGIPLEKIQEVVDQTRAAGVRGSVHFSLTFLENHAQSDEPLRIEAAHRATEDAQAQDSLLVANVSQLIESHAMGERLNIAGVFDISPFDGPFGFL
ncbi:MAG TPA: hypothetical protein VJZ26_14510 [Blastocatellia bacterium]|nr:hypothetical protein [Blastocatellia bacterium]